MAGSGFNHIPNAGEGRKHQSWGRTRQPKNVTGTQNGSIIVDTEYNTENQRYLLVYTSAAVEAGAIVVWSHAIQNWLTLNTADTVANQLHIYDLGGSDKVKCTDLNAGVVKMATSTF
jgi:hypothetical protein